MDVPQQEAGEKSEGTGGRPSYEHQSIAYVTVLMGEQKESSGIKHILYRICVLRVAQGSTCVKETKLIKRITEILNKKIITNPEIYLKNFWN